MPELPEVETIRRQLDGRLRGRRVVAAWGHPSTKFVEASAVLGSELGAVRRRGKYLLIDSSDGRELVIHLGMTGTIDLHTDRTDDGIRPAGRWQRARWDLDDGSVLELGDQRRFGRVAVVETGDYSRLPTLAAIGPEPLGPGFTVDHLQRGLAAGRRRVKTHLLDQRLVAGIGNIYADESLWRARINPVSRRVGPDRAAALHGALVEVLSEAIAHGGTRLRNYRSVEGDTGAHQWHLDCYGRNGRPCPRCGAHLRRRIVDGRGTTWCPRCQAR